MEEPYFDYNRVYFVSPEGLAEHHSSFIHEVENQSNLVPVAPLASSSPIDMAGLQQMEPSSTASTQPSCALISCDEFIVDQVGLILMGWAFLRTLIDVGTARHSNISF